MAVLFGVINLSKWIPYAGLGLFDSRILVTSLVLLPLAPLGVWLGVWATRRIDCGLVLPHRLHRHVPHRREAAVGWPALTGRGQSSALSSAAAAQPLPCLRLSLRARSSAMNCSIC